MKNNKSRRSFLRKATLGTAALGTAPYLLASPGNKPITMTRSYTDQTFAANDQVNVGLIGAGIQGIYDTRNILKVPGVTLTAVCDLYTGRLDRAREDWGDGLFTTRDESCY